VPPIFIISASVHYRRGRLTWTILHQLEYLYNGISRSTLARIIQKQMTGQLSNVTLPRPRRMRKRALLTYLSANTRRCHEFFSGLWAIIKFLSA
jgi:hypothetical protein